MGRGGLAREKVREIRGLRGEGLTQRQVAERVGCCVPTVRKYTGSRPVAVSPLRAAFERSGASAGEVARMLGWWAGGAPDVSRVRRTLGLAPDSDYSGSRLRRRISPETFSQIADAIGVTPAELGS